MQFPTTQPSSGEHTSIPDVTEDLINYLNSVYPNKLPEPGSPYSEIERAWGRREVIDHLIRLKAEIEEENHVLRRRIDTAQG